MHATKLTTPLLFLSHTLFVYRYVGVTVINERPCQGWVKSLPVAVFGWWTSVKTGIPCQLAWMLGFERNMVMSYYSQNASDIPAAVFDIPSYCQDVPTNPHCSIS